jgi:hypothetical protein
METEIQTKRCFLGFDCIEKQCPAWMTFTDVKQGVCAFRIGSSAMRMMPGVISEITGILKKLSLLVFLFLVFAQPVFAQDTWENNKKYIGERLDNLANEVQSLRLDLKCYVDAKATMESTINSQNTKIEAVKEQTTEVQASLKYLYGLLVLSIGGNAVSGGVLLKNRKNVKTQPTNNEI